MKTNSSQLNVASAAAFLTGALPASVSTGQVADRHGQGEQRSIETPGKPSSPVTETDGARVYTYVFEQQVGQRIPSTPKGAPASRWVTQHCKAESQSGADNRVIGARFLGQRCDIKS